MDTAEPIAILYLKVETGTFRFKVFESGTLWVECQRDTQGKSGSNQQFPGMGTAVYEAPVWNLERLDYIVEQYWHEENGEHTDPTDDELDREKIDEVLQHLQDKVAALMTMFQEQRQFADDAAKSFRTLLLYAAQKPTIVKDSRN